MVTKSTPIKTLLASLFVFVLFLCSLSCGPSGNTNNTSGGGTVPTATATASPSPTPVDCTTATPEVIVKAIYSEIKSLQLGKEVFNFNISVTSPPQVNIIGWSIRKPDIIDAIGKAAPNCKIDQTYFYDNQADFKPPYQRVGCSGGYKPCGEVCIPDDQHCAWAGTVDYRFSAANANTSSGPVSNSNSNSNTAARANANSNTNTAKKP